MSSCGPLDFGCQQMDAFKAIVGSLASWWLSTPTPDFNGGASVTLAPATAPTQAVADINELLGVVMWVGGGIGVAALVVTAVLFATGRAHRVDHSLTGFVRVLFGAILLGAATPVAAALVQSTVRDTSGGVVGFIQRSTGWLTIAVATASIMVGAIALMLGRNRFEPDKFGTAILRFLLTAGAGTFFIATGTAIADAAAKAIIEAAAKQETACVDAAACSQAAFNGILNFAAVGPLGQAALLLTGLFGFLVALTQMVLMIARTAILILLCGVLPLIAAFAMMRQGENTFTRINSLVLGLILYKPAASIVIATGLVLMSDKGVSSFAFGDDFSRMIGGIVLLLLSVIALPVLVKLITPASVAVGGAVGGAGGVVMASAAMGAQRQFSQSNTSQSSSSVTATSSMASSTAASNGATLAASAAPAVGGGAAAAGGTAGSALAAAGPAGIGLAAGAQALGAAKAGIARLGDDATGATGAKR